MSAGDNRLCTKKEWSTTTQAAPVYDFRLRGRQQDVRGEVPAENAGILQPESNNLPGARKVEVPVDNAPVVDMLKGMSRAIADDTELSDQQVEALNKAAKKTRSNVHFL